MYANNLLSINGLQFGGRVDDAYMDAITINLKNVTFPNTSEVMARSRDGSINAGTGSVNFLGNVKHGTDLITGAAGGAINEFNGIDGHWDLNKKLENGKSASLFANASPSSNFTMKKIFISLFIFSFTSAVFAQTNSQVRVY